MIEESLPHVVVREELKKKVGSDGDYQGSIRVSEEEQVKKPSRG